MASFAKAVIEFAILTLTTASAALRLSFADCDFGFAVGSLGELALPELALVLFVFLPEDISISLPELSGCNS